MAFATIEAQLEEMFGLPLLGYLCAVGPEAMDSRLAREGALPERAEAILGHLAQVAQSATGGTADGAPTELVLVDLLSRFDRENGTSFGNVLRLAAGGAIVDVNAEDNIEAGLQTLARDQYPALLIPTESPWHMSLHSFGHPLRADLDAALLADEGVSGLFPEADGGLGRRGTLYTSLGTGGTLQSAMLPDTIVNSSWQAARMESPVPSPDDLLRHVSRVVDVVRRVATGRTVDIPCLVAFTGVRLAEGELVPTPWGTFRETTAAEQALSPKWIEGGVGGTDESGQHVSVTYAGDVILSTTLPLRVKVTAAPLSLEEGSDWPGGLLNDALQIRTEAIQLAALLAVDRPAGSWVVAKPAWWMIANPFNPAPHIASQGRGASNPGFMPYELSADDAKEMSRWIVRIGEHRTPSISVSVRRLLSASSARLDATDRLVDAVIVWENLFGTSQGEVSLRLSASLACLLESDLSARKALQSTLAKLYRQRSKIVHGDEVEMALIPTWANEATTYARRALAVLLRDCPELLPLTSTERSMRLILGA